MQSKAATVEAYLAGLPEDRRQALEAVRKVVLKNLDKDYEEGIQYGMIGYYVPHRVHPPGYHCDPKQPLPFAGLASQKNYMSLYLMCIYGDSEHAEWFRRSLGQDRQEARHGKVLPAVQESRRPGARGDRRGDQSVPASKYIKHCVAAIKPENKQGQRSTYKVKSAAQSAKRAKSRPGAQKFPRRIVTMRVMFS